MSLNLWFDGRIGPQDQLAAPLTTHAMHYGTAVFEGIRSYATPDGAAVFRLPEHLERMRKGAEAFGAKFDVNEAAAAVIAVLQSNHHRDAYIRPLLWYGTGSLGLDVAPLSKHLMVASMPWKPHLGDKPVRLTVSPFRRNRADAMPPLKLSGAYVNSILAKREAGSRGFDDALFLDDAGFVVECTGVNVFLVKAGQVTAVEHSDALPGITRDTIVELAGAASRPVTLEELLEADEVFLTGTSAEVMPVAALDRKDFGATPVADELRARYLRVVRGGSPAHARWLTPV
ncbi:aminotransferase class IV [Arenimonas daejeonensis]|uniref:aminotransferase class IV n=1 Tax=Arenimonas daejeonensis TaxID=370777 RepID=UPI0011BD901A|nr:aminotransferase class IV [Arenimonas daejeonensis]